MVVTVGFFDGVHLGHRRVLRSLLERGEQVAVITFWPHPRVVLQQDAHSLALLNTREEKMARLQGLGINDIRCLDFTPEMSRLSAEEFIRDILVGEFGCTELVLGHDNRLGCDGLCTEDIAQLARKMGLGVEVVPSFQYKDIGVSSTRIRQAIFEGDVALAAELLGYRYPLSGIVVRGHRLGRTIGFPTANIKPSFPLKAVPGNGVYAVDVIVNGKKFKGMTNIGTRPTVGDNLETVIETNIFDFDEDIYGMEITVEFIDRVRNEKKFASLEELAGQLKIDKHRCYGYN
ncbi:MAG: bifunctional riboflavin kinase/FAD synthetase [Bacteroidales bacterium]|nr:bifunctional riboflavin kinase/FAD synthetase [Bacteroidales bacterium]